MNMPLEATLKWVGHIFNVTLRRRLRLAWEQEEKSEFQGHSSSNNNNPFMLMQQQY